MTSEEAKNLLDRYQQGLCTPQEKAALESWYDQLIAESDLDLAEEKKDDYYTRMRNAINSGIVQQERKSVRLWPRTAIAAAVATAILSAGIWFYNARQKEAWPKNAIYANDLAPGRQGATLTLASGKKIRLADAMKGKLAKEAGVTITKTAEGELVYQVENTTNENKINTITTANGETYQLRLPDGSAVWLNAGSSLTYSANLVQHGKRSVRLSGEGYFEIAKDRLHPFIVETKNQQVEVLGTKFNINSYTDEPVTATTLVEGSIKVSSDQSTKFIKPGQQAINDKGELQIQPANLDHVTDWREGDFNLVDLDFKTAMRKIARWYDVEVIYDPSVSNSLKAGGWIKRDTKLSEVLKLIERSGQVRFKIDGKKLYVTPS